MSIGAALNLIIGLVFAYFLLALIASGVQEVIAAAFTWRGTYLSKAIDVIIDNDPDARWGWSSFGEFMRAHFTPWAPPTAADRLKARIGNGPVDAQDAALQRVLSVQAHPLVRGSPTDLPSYVPARNFALALMDALRDGSQAPLFTQAEHTVAALPDGDLKRTLTVFLQDAGGDCDKLRAELERWFDDAMDRLSGIYKRFSQYVVLILGLAIAVALNVDSTRMARMLWQEPGVMNAIVADATVWARTGVSAPGGACGQAQGATGVIGPVGAAASCFEKENFPIGWGGDSFGTWTVPGWIITALAVGLGAPFWFGLLQQLVNLRSAGPVPAKSAAGTDGSTLTSS